MKACRSVSMFDKHICLISIYVTGSDILSLMEPKIGNFVFYTFMYIIVSLQQISRSSMNWRHGLLRKIAKFTPTQFSYPPHLCRGVYSFRLSVRLFVHDSIPFVELLQSFTLKFLKWGISHQPLIRKHSYLDHRKPGGTAFSP